MPALSDEELSAQIRAAWADAVRPRDNKICNPTYDDEGVSAYFAGRPWHGHDAASLRWHSVGLSFFSPAGFCYYLPAYLLAVIENIRGMGDIYARLLAGPEDFYGSIFYHLSPSQLDTQWADNYRARIAGFDEAQKRAIIAYLEWCREKIEEPDGMWRSDLLPILTYLSTGEVRGAETIEERLLQLGGQRGRPLEQVTSLSLSYTKVRDEDLAGLAGFCELRELVLAGTELSDDGLAHLSTLEVSAALAKLEKLDLSNGTRYSAEGLFHLNALPSLVELRLPNSYVDDRKLAAFDALKLRALDLTHCGSLTEHGLAKLDVSRLERLSMYGVAATDALMTRLGDAAVLRELTCSGASEAGVIALASRARSPALVSLDLGKAMPCCSLDGLSSLDGIGAPALAALARLSALAKLKLEGVDVEIWPFGFPALVELSLLGGSLSAEAAAGLAELPALTQLGCFGETLAPGALGALARSRSLRRLTLYSEELDDARFLELAGSAVERMTVNAPRLGNAALAVFAQLPRLEELHLTGLAITDDAMAHLATAPALRTLHLEGSPIGNPGLRLLVDAPALRTLRLAGAKVTNPGVAMLKRKRPALEIVQT